jgi:hypothetical protein
VTGGAAAGSATGTAELRGRALGWYLPALAGTLAPLAVGFFASAEANRIAYAAWGLAGALAWIVALRLLLGSRRRARAAGAGGAVRGEVRGSAP